MTRLWLGYDRCYHKSLCETYENKNDEIRPCVFFDNACATFYINPYMKCMILIKLWLGYDWGYDRFYHKSLGENQYFLARYDSRYDSLFSFLYKSLYETEKNTATPFGVLKF